MYRQKVSGKKAGSLKELAKKIRENIKAEKGNGRGYYLSQNDWFKRKSPEGQIYYEALLIFCEVSPPDESWKKTDEPPVQRIEAISSNNVEEFATLTQGLILKYDKYGLSLENNDWQYDEQAGIYEAILMFEAVDDEASADEHVPVVAE